jgi:Immunity protein 44
MYLWLSAEETNKISDAARLASNALEEQVNKHLIKIDVGEWKKWCVIFIMLPEEFTPHHPETRRLTRKDMALDFRVAIDYQAAVAANFDRHIELMVEALKKTIPYFKRAKISDESQRQIIECLSIAATEIKASHSTIN